MTHEPLNIPHLVAELDRRILRQEEDALTLDHLAWQLGYSQYYVSRRFRQAAGLSLRDYLRYRRLAFALRDLRDTGDGILDIALRYGFSSHEAFTRAFQAAYGVAPSVYRAHPAPVVLHTVLRPFDCYLLGVDGSGMAAEGDCVKTYFVTLPAHKFLHIRNDRSIGYFDFWQKQSEIPGQDHETVCALLDQIPGKLDDAGGQGADAGSGQLMAFLNEPEGRICSWGIPLSEAWGVRLPPDYAGAVPPPLRLMDVPAGDYVVFEHGPFDLATENQQVEAAMERAMKDFDYARRGCALDTTQGRVFYFYHDSRRFWKYVRPIRWV